MKQFNKDGRVGGEIPTGQGDVLNVLNQWGKKKERESPNAKCVGEVLLKAAQEVFCILLPSVSN